MPQAPCAQSALSYNVQSQTNDKCPEAVTDLQSCVCTKNNNLAAISSKISVSISYSCGSTATDDQASAFSVSIVRSQAHTVGFADPLLGPHGILQPERNHRVCHPDGSPSPHH